jgi:MGT family glycosyltransferase
MFLDVMSTKVAVFCLPASGHLNPLLAMVGELTRRGVEVDVWGTERWRKAVEASGAWLRPLPALERFEALDSRLGMFAFAELLASVALETTPALSEALQRSRPDLVVYDAMTPCGAFVARALRLPAVATYASFGNVPERSPLPPVPVLLAVHGPRHLPANLGRFFRRRALMAQALDRYGVDQLAFPNVVSSPADCNIVFTSEPFQIFRDRLDERFHFVGPCIGARGDPGDFPLAELDGQKVVYVSLGTVFHSDLTFFRRCLEAFGQGFKLVMSVGATNDPAALGPLPPGCIVRRHVPQLEVLKRAALCVTHGGMNSVNEAMLERVPMVVAPQAADQFLVARRVKELGLGARLGPRLPSAARLRAMGEAVMADGGVRAKLAELSSSLMAGGGAAKAAELALAHVNRGSTARAA